MSEQIQPGTAQGEAPDYGEQAPEVAEVVQRTRFEDLEAQLHAAAQDIGRLHREGTRGFWGTTPLVTEATAEETRARLEDFAVIDDRIEGAGPGVVGMEGATLVEGNAWNTTAAQTAAQTAFRHFANTFKEPRLKRDGSEQSILNKDGRFADVIRRARKAKEDKNYLDCYEVICRLLEIEDTNTLSSSRSREEGRLPYYVNIEVLKTVFRRLEESRDQIATAKERIEESYPDDDTREPIVWNLNRAIRIIRNEVQKDDIEQDDEKLDQSAPLVSDRFPDTENDEEVASEAEALAIELRRLNTPMRDERYATDSDTPTIAGNVGNDHVHPAHVPVPETLVQEQPLPGWPEGQPLAATREMAGIAIANTRGFARGMTDRAIMIDDRIVPVNREWAAVEQNWVAVPEPAPADAVLQIPPPTHAEQGVVHGTGNNDNPQG